MRRFLVLSLMLVAFWQLGSAGWIQAKAGLGQWLLERAWQRTLEGGEASEPWPGAVSHPIARLRMPRLSVDHLVLEGLDTPVMAWGPGMAVGQGGQHVLAAHRDTHFSFLRDVETGDRFELIDAGGQRQWWRVEAIRVVDSRKTGIDLDRPGAVMTLITCYPFDAPVAGGPQRLVVQLRPLAPQAEERRI
ncbi:sortase domain-containing protein [Wenzhouxiangella sp. EGI_FJ10305]|uniref:sortase domain-containing protein n=1 Tax=Wenzhouxiangella sp. EGI_FJ10305 TaxID=3243768 RepID=UPI0035E200D7